MIKFTGVFDNSIASPMKPLDFVKEYYLSTMGRKELVDSSIQQESTFAALKHEESAQHSLQQLKEISLGVGSIARDSSIPAVDRLDRIVVFVNLKLLAV